MKTVEIEVFVCVDDCGDYAVGKESANAIEAYEGEVQALTDAGGFRMVKLTLTVPLPEIVEMTGEVPALGEPAALKVEG